MQSQHTAPDQDDQQLIDAVYQDGVIKPLAQLNLPDGTQLQIRLSTVTTPDSVAEPQLNAQAGDAAPAVTEVALPRPAFEVRQHLRRPLLRIAVVALALTCGYTAHRLAGDAPLSPHPWIAVFVWLLGIGLAVIGCLPTQIAPNGPKSEHSWVEQPWSPLETAAVAGLFIVALLVRLINIGSVPGALTGDEGGIGLMAVAITQGRFNNPFITGWFSFPSLFFDYAPERGQGDPNTQVATSLGKQLASYAPNSEIYFLGPPRMGYGSIPTVPFLAPQVKGIDVPNPLTAAPNWQLAAPRTLFVFLPERQHEAALVERRYPGGVGMWVPGYNGKPLYYTYEVEPQDSLRYKLSQDIAVVFRPELDMVESPYNRI
jgi:predicted DNA-binding antitoxin AbrB/MazE fold protein